MALWSETPVVLADYSARLTDQQSLASIDKVRRRSAAVSDCRTLSYQMTQDGRSPARSAGACIAGDLRVD
jgi:hypothetical protein